MQISRLEKSIATGDSVRGKRLPYRNDYYHHFKEMEQGFAGLKNILSTPADIDPMLVGVSDNTKPKSRWAGFMQRRSGAEYEADAVGGMLKYIPVAEYKINMDGVIANNRDIIKSIQEATTDSRNANGFVEWLTDWTNDMAGKTNPIDRAAQKLTNRKVMAAINWINGRVKSNAVLGNLNSAVSQIYNLPNAAGYIKNPAHMAQGLGDWAKSLVGNKEINELLKQSGFMEERYLEKSFKQFDEGILKAPRKFAEWLLNVGDEQSAKWIWFSAYENGKSKGVKDLISYADDITRKSVAGRGIGEIPVFYQSRLVQLVTPFQIEVNNSFQVLKERIGKKDALGVVEIAAAGWLLNNLGESITGNRVAFDPINAIQEAWEGADEDADLVSKITATGTRLGGEVVSNMPGGTFIGSMLVPDENQRQAIFGDSDPSRFGTGNIGIDALTEPFRDALYNLNQKRNGSDSRRNPDWIKWGLTVGLPFGGKQADRSLKAAQDFGWLPRRGEAGNIAPDMPANYSQSGRFRFALDPLSLAKKAQALAFGSFATPEGQAYLDSGRAPLSDKKTGYIQEAYQAGISPQKFMDIVEKTRDLEPDKDADGKTMVSVPEKQRRILLQDPDLTPQQKKMMDQWLVNDVMVIPQKKDIDYSSPDGFESSSLPESQQELWQSDTVRQVVGNVENFARIMDAVADVEPDKDKYGNAVAGSSKTKKIGAISEVMNISRLEAEKIYEDVFERKHSINDFSSAQREHYERGPAKIGVTEEQFIDCMNLIRDVKAGDDISLNDMRVKTLTEAGYPKQDAQAFVKSMFQDKYSCYDLK